MAGMVDVWLRWSLFVVVTGGAIWLFMEVVRRRIAYIRLGMPTTFERHKKQSKPVDSGTQQSFGKEVFGHRKLLKDVRSGMMHLIFFYGFIVLQFGALDLIWKGLNKGSHLPIPFYAYFSWFQEVTVFLVLAAVIYSAYRRYGERMPRLKRGWKPSLVMWFLGVLMLSVLLTLAFERLADTGANLVSAHYAPISEGIAQLLALVGVADHSVVAIVGFEILWWTHLVVLLSFMLYVPQSKHFHLLVAPVNLWYRRNTPTGRLTPLNLEDEEAESFGAGKIEHFTQKQLVDLYACVECGRCTNVCPAASTGKLLSPMHLMIKLRDHLTEKGAAITSRSPWLPGNFWQKQEQGAYAHVMGATMPAWEMVNADSLAGRLSFQGDITPTMEVQAAAWGKRKEAKAENLDLIGDVITEEELWACTTCRNCEEQCPVGNEHVDKIIDMRRHLVLMEGKLPADGQRTLQNIERQGNPWGLPRAERAAWMEECERKTGIRIETLQERRDQGKRTEIVLWAGSMGSYDTRSKRVLFDLVRLMKHAGLTFATLGQEERSSGDTARRIGNELLFQELCRDNIATFQKYEVRHIVTACPHTFHTFKNEYPDFGMDEKVHVEHHTELLARLVADGRLQPTMTIDEQVTIHDSCYMGRYNDSYNTPRNILRSIPGITIHEMERSGSNGMCCGAGGGMMWMEEQSGTRMNYTRTAQALEVNPSVISSACPYCLTMMEDGLKGLSADDKVIARDVAELLAESVLDEE